MGRATGPVQTEVTALLRAWRAGDESALNRLVPLIYDDLHRVAHMHLAHERPGHTLQTSALVNEAYLRLFPAGGIECHDRAHFIGVCARIMRQVLVHYARMRDAGKRGGGAVRVSLDEMLAPAPERDADVIALDEALLALEKFDPREAKVVELRFFGGLSEAEAAHTLGVSERTIRREWDHARAWLMHRLKHRSAL